MLSFSVISNCAWLMHVSSLNSFLLPAMPDLLCNISVHQLEVQESGFDQKIRQLELCKGRCRKIFPFLLHGALKDRTIE